MENGTKNGQSGKFANGEAGSGRKGRTYLGTGGTHRVERHGEIWRERGVE